MASDVGSDQLALIRIDGMHCHKCEQAIQKNLSRLQGVFEVEVDFASGQASVLFDRSLLGIDELTQAVADSGYEVAGFTLRDTSQASS